MQSGVKLQNKGEFEQKTPNLPDSPSISHRIAALHVTALARAPKRPIAFLGDGGRCIEANGGPFVLHAPGN